MRRLALAAAALLSLGCADAVRISAAAGRVVCGALGCPCSTLSSGGARAPVAFDVYPDGGVRAVYAGETR